MNFEKYKAKLEDKDAEFLNKEFYDIKETLNYHRVVNNQYNNGNNKPHGPIFDAGTLPTIAAGIAGVFVGYQFIEPVVQKIIHLSSVLTAIDEYVPHLPYYALAPGFFTVSYFQKRAEKANTKDIENNQNKMDILLKTFLEKGIDNPIEVEKKQAYEQAALKREEQSKIDKQISYPGDSFRYRRKTPELNFK